MEHLAGLQLLLWLLITPVLFLLEHKNVRSEKGLFIDFDLIECFSSHFKLSWKFCPLLFGTGAETPQSKAEND